jgi:hypothetical protein
MKHSHTVVVIGLGVVLGLVAPPPPSQGQTSGAEAQTSALVDLVTAPEFDPTWTYTVCEPARAPLNLDRYGGPLESIFALGKPDQYVPPPIGGWTVIVPPLPPPPPKPGDPAKPPQPWKPLFFDNDFRYLDAPTNTVHNTFDFLKRRRPLGDPVVMDFGGEFRWQARGEDNRRLTGEQNNFNLFRERLYLDTWAYDRIRMYWEVYWADASEQTVAPVFFDIDHGDVNNAFVEARILRDEDDNGWWSARYGWHEELLLGNQRLVSPLDWANVRRTFDLIPHLLYRGKTWNYDLFWSRPNRILPRQLNQPVYAQQFFGSYLTYKGQTNRLYDLYYLGLLSNDQYAGSLNGETRAFAVHTLGLRYQGEQDNWLWEGEAAYQFGQHTNTSDARTVDRNAGMATAGFGRRFADALFRPELWFFFDYASGNRYPGSGDYSTFNQLFPLGHKYFGYMDIVGRQNIIDPNVNLKFFLGKRANLLFWYHNFHLASARDALYNGAGNPIRTDPSGAAGRYVGDELDVVLGIYVNPNTDWQIGLSHFWAGPFVQDTAPTPAAGQGGNFFYTQFTFRF